MTNRLARWDSLDADLREHVDISNGQYLPDAPLIFDADSPDALREGRLERAVRAGLELCLYAESVESPEPLSLRLLEPVISDLHGLHIFSELPPTDLDILLDAEALTSLHLALGRAPKVTDLSNIPQLRHLSVSGRDLERLFPGDLELATMSLSSPHKAAELTIRAQVRSLALINLARRVTIINLDWPLEVRSFFLKGAATFSLEALASCDNLETLEINQCDNLTGLRVIPGLTKLKKLDISLTSSPEPWIDLLDTPAPQVLVQPLDELAPSAFEQLQSRGWLGSRERW